MKKDKKNVLVTPSDKIAFVLEELNGRILQLEYNAKTHTQMLNANLLRLASLIDILIKNEMITDEEIEATAKEILVKVKQQTLEMKEEYANAEKEMDDFDNMGHA